MATITLQDVDPLLQKIAAGTSLAPAELKSLQDLLNAMALTVRTQDEQLRYYESLVAILRDANAAALAATNAAATALKSVAPPNASIDAAQAVRDIEKLRTDIKNSAELANTLASVAKFSIAVVGKFV